MIRVAVLLLWFAAVPAHGQPASSGGFDHQRVTSVFAEALTFMVPRILDPVPVSQLTVWGLRGLTALDPALITSQQDGRIRLATQTRILFEAPAPPDENPIAWANTAAVVTAAGYSVSAAVRRAGNQGVIQSFFDELFNHLDPYSRYVAPGDAGEDRARRAGRAGLGMTVADKGGVVVVQSVIQDGPAALAGLRTGDSILAVDRRLTRSLNARTVTGMIEGPEETEVGMTWRGRDGRVRTDVLVRAMVPPETVFFERTVDTLTVRITGFSRSTDLHLANALREGLTAPRPVTGIMLDLRGNRGGLLRQAVTAADTLLTPGIVAMTSGRAPEANHVWRSTTGQIGGDVPVVVIVDGRTASAAEILAAALADRGRAVVVGSATLGKGLVQTIDPLPDGAELFVTWSRVLAPRGWPIQGLGLLPQVCSSRGQDALFRQMTLLSAGTQPMAQDLAAHRAARAPLSAQQILMIRSACPAAEGRDLDVEAARLLLGNLVAYGTALLPATADPR